MQPHSKQHSPIKTVLTIVLGLLFFAMYFKQNNLFLVAFILGVLGLFFPYVAIKIDWFWMKLSWVLSKIMPNILLTIFFYLFLTPIAFLSRIFGEKNVMTIKNTKESMFKEVNKTFPVSSFEKPW